MRLTMTRSSHLRQWADMRSGSQTVLPCSRCHGLQRVLFTRLWLLKIAVARLYTMSLTHISPLLRAFILFVIFVLFQTPQFTQSFCQLCLHDCSLVRDIQCRSLHSSRQVSFMLGWTCSYTGSALETAWSLSKHSMSSWL